MIDELGSGGERLRRRLGEADARYGLLAGVSSVLVACSGGADSVALLHLLFTMRDELGLRVGVAHLHHGLRGAEADADAAYVAELAERLGLPLVGERADVPARARERGQSLEAAAREARYEFLERAAEAGGWERVALGHTGSDRVESVLLNLLRGSGLHGLRGMPAARGRFIRPLLTAWRAETEAYCAHWDLHPRLDRSNLDPEHATRNRVRLELLPLLRAQYNPAADEALLRLAEAVEEELEWTEPQVAALAEGALRATSPPPCPPPLAGEGGKEGSVAIHLAALAGAPAGLRYRLLREAWTRVTGESWDLSAADYRALDHLARGARTGSEIALPRDIVAQKGYNDIRLVPGARGRISPPPLESHPLGDERTTLLPEVGLTVRLERLAQPPGELGDARRCQIVMDAARVAWPLGVRGWQPGDRLIPLGMSGHRKVQDLFTDNKVPREQRRRVPLVVDAEDEVVWVVGHALSERVKVTSETREYVRITVRSTGFPACAAGPEK
jgi:tRNA(Ile)-lysidine synthase